MENNLPMLGVGLGYRHHLQQEIQSNRAAIDFLELITDQVIYSPPEKVDRLLESLSDFPIVPHSVALSVGTEMPFDDDYLDRTARLLERVNAPWYSDHLSFTKVPDVEIGQLTPLWFTRESLEIVCRKVQYLKQRIAVPFLLENITYYFPIPGSEMSEAEFITEVLERTDCGLLLDLNNVFINSRNHNYDPYKFLESIPLERTVQIHFAGHREENGLVIDSHADRTSPEVFALMKYTLENAPVRGISLEWDENFPEDFGVLLEELQMARSLFAPSLAAPLYSAEARR